MSAQFVSLLLLLALASLSGCNALREPSSAHTSAPYEPTALIIADESRPLTVEELAAQRPAIVAYLVKRGYLKTADAIVDNPAQASRIIRVILSPSGSFRITEFTLGNRARRIMTSSFTPERPSGDTHYNRAGRREGR